MALRIPRFPGAHHDGILDVWSVCRDAIVEAPQCCSRFASLTLSHSENAAPKEPGARHWRRGAERAGPFLLVVLLVVLWQVLTRAFDIPKFLLPAPTDVAQLMVSEWALIQMHSLATIGSIVSGYLAAVLFALVISALMIRYPLFERLIMPIFVGLQSVPKIAIAPLILVWVGAGIGSKIAVVASIAFFPVVINTMAGFKEVDRGLSDVFRSVDANERQMFFRLRLPYAMPYIFAGLRIATTLSVLGAIVAEWLAASNGLGYLVLSGSFNFNTARSFAAIIALAVIGTAFFSFMSWVERIISWKHEGSNATTQV
jgi:NitT/TauT family transport system permease protein